MFITEERLLEIGAYWGGGGLFDYGVYYRGSLLKNKFIKAFIREGGALIREKRLLERSVY